MARWEPDARGRLLAAALDLFAEQDYETTTAAQIAERAGLTRTTLFRLFADKREILFQGQPAFVAIIDESVATAPDRTPAPMLLRIVLRALSAAHVPEQQDIGRRIERLIATTDELRERAAFKRSALTAALEAALLDRVGSRPLAGALADLGIRAYYDGFTLWTGPRSTDPLVEVVLDELDELERALSGAVVAPPDAALAAVAP